MARSKAEKDPALIVSVHNEDNQTGIQNQSESKETKKSAAPKKPVARDVDLNEIVTVRNGFQGRLIYISRKTGEKFVWESFGDEQDMEIGELRNARSSSKMFFEKNWFMFDDAWIVDYLGVSKYYKYAVKIEDFDRLFELTPEELKEAIDDMSAGQRKSLEYRARQMISDGAIDSNKIISTLESGLQITLIER